MNMVLSYHTRNREEEDEEVEGRRRRRRRTSSLSSSDGLVSIRRRSSIGSITTTISTLPPRPYPQRLAHPRGQTRATTPLFGRLSLTVCGAAVGFCGGGLSVGALCGSDPAEGGDALFGRGGFHAARVEDVREVEVHGLADGGTLHVGDGAICVSKGRREFAGFAVEVIGICGIVGVVGAEVDAAVGVELVLV